jgi:tetratricopeptide (TPR) repeat protein
MKRVRMVGVVIIAVALALTFARPMEASPQVPPTSEMAADLEAAAARLHDRPERWADAARLYLVAADLRQQEDPEARKSLFKAASLYHQTGDIARAVAALESAAARARAAGDPAEARRMFARAAWVARDAGLTAQRLRLEDRATHS